MRVAVFLAAIFIGATASPNGYYHQQYNYKTSSSSYKNNELQHRTDDQGSYSKDGDLEGRVKPKVSSNSEHSEYVNPQLRERLNAGYLDAETDLSSQGHLLANNYGASIGSGISSGYQSGSRYENDLYEGLASSDHIGGATNVYGAYGSGLSQSSYGSSELRTVASRLQNELQHQIQEALQSQSRYQSHQIDISQLEAELRRNLTSRLNEILQERYGAQTIRGGQSYSLSGGRLQTRPNYEQHELENLQKQVENSLLQELRTSYSRGQQSHNQNYAYYETTTTYRPTTYRAIYPNLNVITTPRPFPEYPGGSKDTYYSQHEYNNRVSSNYRYTPVPNPLSITTIASNVQSQLDSRLNQLLEQTQRQYFSEGSGYNVHNLESILERLRQELKNNLTYALDEELRGQYGTQVQKNNYMFSVGSGGEISGQYNYNVADLENLRRQVESNLLTKLNRDFESARQRWITRQQSQRTSYGHSQSSDYQYGSSSNNQLYNEEDYYRPTAASIVPLISTGIKGNPYKAVSGSHQATYESSATGNNIVELQRQLQTDLSRQLQAAINQNKGYMSRYSTGGSGGYGGTFEEAYQRLYNDLQRNLTQQLQEFEAGSSGYSSSYGSVSDAQLASLKSQLQRNLASQLQSGLQQSFSASASYSASSGSSSSTGAGAYGSSNSGYRTARGSENYPTGYSGYGQYVAGASYHGMEGEDCLGDDPNAYQNKRTKRSYDYRSRPLGLSTHSGTGYSTSGTGYGSSGYEGYSSGYHSNLGGYSSSGYGGSSNSYRQQTPQTVGQEEDDSDTIQRVEPFENFNGQQEIDLGQQVDDSDDTQQVEVDHGFGTLALESANQFQSNSHQQKQFAQEKIESNSHLIPSESNRNPSQYTNFNGYGKLELGSQNPVNSDLIQKQENMGFGVSSQNFNYATKPNGGISDNPQSQSNVGQEIDDSDLTQQVEDINFDNISQLKPNRKPIEYNSNTGTTQTVSNVANFVNHIQSTTQKYLIPPIDLQPTGQEVDDTDTTQQISQPDFGKLGIGALVQSTTQKYLIPPIEPQRTGQEVDDTDTTQQISQPDFGKLGVGALVQTSTKKPQTLGSNFNYISNPKYETSPINSELKPVGQETDHSHTLQENNIQVSRETNNDFSNLGNINHENTPYVSPISTWELPNEVKDVFQRAESNITKQIESTIKTDISFSIAPNQLYRNILQKLQSNINHECQRILNDHSYYLNIDQSSVSKLESYLKIRLQEKLQQEFLKYGFTREQLGISTFDNVHQSNYNNYVRYSNQQRHLNFNGYQSRPKSSNDFIQREITSGDDVNDNNRQLPINRNPYVLPTLNEVAEGNRQIYGSGEQIVRQHTTTSQPINQNRRPWSSTSFHPDSAAGIRNTENNTPKIKIQGDTGEPSYIPTDVERKPIFVIAETGPKQNNDRWVNIGLPDSPPAKPGDQVLDNKTNVPSNQLEGNPGDSPTPNTSSVDPLDLSNFPPLPPPQNSGSEIPVIKPQRVIPQEPSSYQTSRQWSTVIDEKQSVNDAQREADLLIEKLRAAQRNRQTSINTDQQANTNTYDTHHRSRTYLHRTTIQNVPNQYDIIQVKLENITPDQLRIIDQIDEDFTNVIDKAVQNELKSTSGFKKSLEKLETELKINLTESLEGNFHSHLGTTDLDLNQYSTLIAHQFEPKKIPDLKKYLEIKFIKKVREQLRKAYKVDNEEDFESQQSTRTSYDRASYQPPVGYEVIQVKLENITPKQLNIITQLENDFDKQIEATIQDHLTQITPEYLSSYNNYQTLCNELEKQLKNNITEYVQGASEPGLSKYSDLIIENFDERKITQLEKYLQIKLSKKLRENLKTHFNFNTAGTSSLDSLNSGFSNYNRRYHNYHSSHNYEVQYGHSHNLDSDFEKAVEIDPVEFQHASAIIPSPTPYSRGVKGGKLRSPISEIPAVQTSYSSQNNDLNANNFQEHVEATTNADDIIEATTEKAGWWKRFGNKVKQGASNLKKKIVGES